MESPMPTNTPMTAPARTTAVIASSSTGQTSPTAIGRNVSKNLNFLIFLKLIEAYIAIAYVAVTANFW